MNIRPHAGALLRTLCASLLVLCTASAQEDLAGWLSELEKAGDDAEPKLVRQIAATGTREAMDGLLEAYERMSSILMRREIVRGLGKFDGVESAQQPAFEKIANVAAGASERELREAALAVLGKSEGIGRNMLRQIVESDAHDYVREPALGLHVKRATPADADFYRYLWNPELERRKDEEGNILGFELEAIREHAFRGLAAQLGDAELVETMRRELNPKIRRKALDVLRERDSPQTDEMAKWLFERVDFPGPDRANAAKILVALEGPKAASKFIKLAKKRDVTPEDLRQTMAQLITEMNDPSVNKKISKLVGKGKPHEKVFALLATAHLSDPKLLKRIRKGLKDKDVTVRRASAQSLAKRRDKESLPLLEKMMGPKSSPEDVRIAIDAMSRIQGTSSTWIKQLSEFAKSEAKDVRNAALEQLGKSNDIKYTPLLLAALTHEDWSTRFVAIRALRSMRDKASIPPLIDRLEAEKGRMEKSVAETLWTLTAQPFDKDVNRWRTWWKAEGDDFRVISTSRLRKAEKEREMRRLRARTTTEAEFFGIRIESHRVIFIIDTSGSMTDPVWGRYVGKRGATRIDIAKQELTQAVKGLEPGALFNILAFSSGIGYWAKEGIGGIGELTRDDALEWIDRLGAGGATNLYDTVKVAFEDPDVDTIFIMSDGEPTAGAVIDPHRIREDVRTWNEHRGIKIHTIAIGGNLEVLEWLAEDAGGDHVRIR